MDQEKNKIQNIINNNLLNYANLIGLSIIALVILTPIVFYPYLIRIFNPPKELAYQLLVLISLAIWALRLTEEGIFKIISTPLNMPLLCYILICLLSLFWSVNPSQSLLKIPLFLAGPILFFITVNNIEGPKQLYSIIGAVLIAGSLLGIYGILQYLGIDFSFWKANVGRNKVFGLFGNVNYFAEYIIIPLTISVPLFFSARNKLLKVLLFLGIIAMGSALLFTFTRGSYLGFALALIFMFSILLFWEGKDFFRKYRKTVLFLSILLIGIILIVFIPNPLNEKGTTIYQIKTRISLGRLAEDTSLARRIATWKFTWLMIRDNPIRGSGLGAYPYNSLRYQAQFFAQDDNRSLYPYGIATHAHNEYLQLWAELGIGGLMIFIWIIIRYYQYSLAYLKREKRKKQEVPALIIGLMGAVLAVLVDALFGFPLHLPASVSLFWLIIALTIVFVTQQSYAEEQDINQDKDNLLIKKKKEVTEQKYRKDIFKMLAPLVKFRYLLYLLIIVLTLVIGILIIRPFMAEVQEFYAFQNIQKEDFNKAIKHYEAALKWNPYFGMAYFNIGQILAMRELNTMAIEYFEKAALYIDHPDLPEKLAYLYIRKGLIDKAIPKLEQAILYQAKKIDMVPLYSDLGKLYLQKKKYKEAEYTFRDALKIDEKEVFPHLGLSVALLNQNREEEALKELKKVVEIAPDSAEAEQARSLLQQIARKNLQIP